MSPVAVLLCRSAVKPKPPAKAGGQTQAAGEGRKPVAEAARENAPEIRAQGPHHPTLDHVKAPEQQRDTAHQVEENDRTQERPPSRTNMDPRREAIMLDARPELAGCCQKLQRPDLFPPERDHALLGAYRGVDVRLHHPIDRLGLCI
jgi:hypothetical protein